MKVISLNSPSLFLFLFVDILKKKGKSYFNTFAFGPLSNNNFHLKKYYMWYLVISELVPPSFFSPILEGPPLEGLTGFAMCPMDLIPNHSPTSTLFKTKNDISWVFFLKKIEYFFIFKIMPMWHNDVANKTFVKFSEVLKRHYVKFLDETRLEGLTPIPR